MIEITAERQEKQVTQAPLQTKNHFEILDGLRGVAALSVLIFHFMEIAVPDFPNNFIAHAYLAVDFFFCLSGFVIAYAYDGKLNNIGIGNFMKLRLIRLHPLVIITSIIGLLAFIFDPFSDLATKYSDKLPLLFLASCLMIPYPLVTERYSNFFHLNAPMWSLFWEYIANIAYALILVRLGKNMLRVVTVIAAALIIYESNKSGHLSVGWGLDNFWGGAVRVFYSFSAGMLIYRSKWIIKSRLGFGALSVLLIFAFIMPFRESTNHIVDTLLVLIYFPLIVALGAGAVLNPSVAKICRWSGELSYPLYMVHYPFMWWYFSWTQKYKPSMPEMVTVMIAGIAIMIALAYAVHKYLDFPIRRYFKKFLPLYPKHSVGKFNKPY